ncbi:TPA: hypothetical protein L4Q76_001758 [Pseudomonas aeruginosa]|uniref:hypothetical protein n=1 Tax=Pseudomonas aeruginosa TaxID=287 RepID=UPI0004F321FB|nr:hypothetical protein [Pseudomonas aeruginosa]MBH4028543.1 hypothetical protein [Pseudomonas aeruginosa]MBV5530487.1 hypothetical protein [Pseudomonas aeruginosa]MCS8095468.1 hypothetical protein [Pseudomonas aeruginosa]RTS98560.1 hypothetical protein DY952_10595 [Pseudomonas aeruginosa]HBO2879737.1 hypothetical protein [Pseudomonas aeruginosa]
MLRDAEDRYLDTVQADIATRRAVLQAELDARIDTLKTQIDEEKARAATAGRLRAGMENCETELCRGATELCTDLCTDPVINR